MAQDASNDINYYLVIDGIHKADLANIRHWNNLKIAFDENRVWVKDFSYAQINSIEVKSIPYKKSFYAKHGKLFLQGSLLPDRNIPSLLWTPIDRAIPIRLPSFNHNYFGVQEKVPINLVPSDREEEAVAMITGIVALQQYIETAPAIRLQKLMWVILDNDKVLLHGRPLLPIAGNVFWKQKDFLIPAGFNFDLFLLIDPLNNLINPKNNYLVVWDTVGTYFLVDKNDMQPLSISSFRSSHQYLSS